MSHVEPLSPNDLARLALDVQPHLDLLQRAAPHMSQIRTALHLLKHLPELEPDMAYARGAPEHLRRDMCMAVYAHAAKKHGGQPELWGALLGEVQARTPQAPTPEAPPAGVVKKRLIDEPALYKALNECQQLLLAVSATTKSLHAELAEQQIVLPNGLLGRIKDGRHQAALLAGGHTGVSIKRAQDIKAYLEIVLEREGKALPAAS